MTGEITQTDAGVSHFRFVRLPGEVVDLSTLTAYYICRADDISPFEGVQTTMVLCNDWMGDTYSGEEWKNQ